MQTAEPGGSAPRHGSPSPSFEGEARQLCIDETRPDPNRGHWRCNIWKQLNAVDIGRAAAAPTGACTHRTTQLDQRAWQCIARLAVPEPPRRPLVGGIPFFGGPLEGNDVCIDQARSDPVRGTWHCTLWRIMPAGYNLVEPLNSPGPCSFRMADQQTGAWSCRSTLHA